MASFGNLAAGEVVASLLRFAGLVWVARELGPAGFGTVSAGLAVATYITMFAHSGLDTVGSRGLARDPEDAPRRIGVIVGLRLLLATAFYALLVAGVLVAPVDQDLRLIILVFGGSAFVLALDVRWAFIGIQRTRPVALASAASAATYVVGILLFVGGTRDLMRVPLVHVAAEGVLAAFLVFVSRRRFGSWRPRAERGPMRTLLAAGLPISLAYGIRSLTITIDVVLVKILLPEIDAGHYAAASRITIVGIAYLGLYYVAFLPSVVRSLDAGQDALRRLATVAAARVAVVGPVVALFATLATPTVIRLLLGPGYAATTRLLQVLIWGLLLLAFTGIYTSVLLAADRQKTLVVITVVVLVVNVASNLVLLPTVGVIGASISTVVTETAMLALTYGAARPYLAPAPSDAAVRGPS